MHCISVCINISSEMQLYLGSGGGDDDDDDNNNNNNNRKPQ
jgi:hypothetical protein